MGFGGIGFGELLLIFVIVVLLFGTKKLSSLGSDLGAAIRGFRQAMHDGEQDAANSDSSKSAKAPINLAHSPPANPETKVENRSYHSDT